MKKRIAMMMIAMAVTFGSVPVFAAQSDAVWLDAENAQITDASVSVPVGTNGGTADGVIEITYDTSVLSIAEDAVVLDNTKVDMSSVNVVEDAVKVSYLSEDNMDSGQFLSLNFQIKEGADAQAVKNALNSMKLSGTVYSESGNEIAVSDSGSQTPGGNDNPGDDNPSGGDKPGNGDEPGNSDEPGGGSTPGDSNPSGNGNNDQTTNQNTQNNTAESDQKKAGNASTGDNTNLMFPGVLAVAGAGAAGAAVYLANTKKKEEE